MEISILMDIFINLQSSAGESFVIGYFDLTSNSDDHDIFTEVGNVKAMGIFRSPLLRCLVG